MTDDAIENLFDESRIFSPPQDFAAKARAQSSLYDDAQIDRIGFWAQQAKRLAWRELWTQIVDESNAPFFRWFVDGKLNATESCLDRHLSDKADKVAFHWEGEPGDRRSLTYQELHDEVCRCANALRELGVQRGDTVAIYMGMVPEITVAMLACARIGAAHSVVFGGFSVDSLVERINDAGCVAVVTCDGAWRRGSVVPLKRNIDAALERTTTVRNVLCYRRTENEVDWTDGRDHWWHELVARQESICEPEIMDSTDLLFILYTSGSTGKPKGIAHGTGGYMTGAETTMRNVFDIRDEDVYWCTADCGWITGHTYIVYGPLACGATSLLFEGTPDHPTRDRWWQLVDKYGVSILYTAPTAIRTFMKWGVQLPEQHDLGSLRLLGTVGEPINPEAWCWYHEHIGHGRCPIVDTWWQTETGSIMISPLPGITATKPGSATKPMPGIIAEVVDDHGAPVERGHGGFLSIVSPWPSMLQTIWGDDDRYVETYWRRFPNRYFAGDGAKIDDDGYLWLLGRVDDVMLVSGHNISTTEVESALVDHDAVAEAAVVGRADDRTGQAIASFVVLTEGRPPSEELAEELRRHVGDKIGPIAKPASVVFTDDVPKTRSGKIMRRLLRDIADNRALGDTSTLANEDIVRAIQGQTESE